MKKILLAVFIAFTMSGECMMQHKVNSANPHVYVVVLAGGSGERLWPLSRQQLPKQLLSIDNDQTLLEQAIDRMSSLVPATNIWVCTTQQYAHMITERTAGLVGNIIKEPSARNTGPALLLSCLELIKNDKQALVIFVSADAYIPKKDWSKYAQFLEHAIDYAQQERKIVLLGVKPTFPATGYGYIEFENHATVPVPVKKFHEKPNVEQAMQYIDQGLLWNTGVFVGQADLFVEEFKKLKPDLFAGVAKYIFGQASYDALPAISVDHAVMERSNNVSVLPIDVAWCDVGNLEVFLSLKQQYEPDNEKKLVLVDAENNLVQVPSKLVALVGVHDLCIVETEQALLIAQRKDAEKIRAVVKNLKQNELKEYL
jgi:mannose-1-phosphate guanylyltransferase